MARHSTRAATVEPRRPPDVASLPEHQRERRQRIVEAAADLMFEVDYERIQVKDVAELVSSLKAAGVI